MRSPEKKEGLSVRIGRSLPTPTNRWLDPTTYEPGTQPPAEPAQPASRQYDGGRVRVSRNDEISDTDARAEIERLLREQWTAERQRAADRPATAAPAAKPMSEESGELEDLDVARRRKEAIRRLEEWRESESERFFKELEQIRTAEQAAIDEETAQKRREFARELQDQRARAIAELEEWKRQERDSFERLQEEELQMIERRRAEETEAFEQWKAQQRSAFDADLAERLAHLTAEIEKARALVAGIVGAPLAGTAAPKLRGTRQRKDERLIALESMDAERRAG